MIRRLLDTHVIQGVILAGAFYLLALVSIELAAIVANGAVWLMREGTQAEKRWLAKNDRNGMSEWRMWLQPGAWNHGSRIDAIFPFVAGAFAAALLSWLIGG